MSEKIHSSSSSTNVPIWIQHGFMTYFFKKPYGLWLYHQHPSKKPWGSLWGSATRWWHDEETDSNSAENRIPSKQGEHLKWLLLVTTMRCRRLIYLRCSETRRDVATVSWWRFHLWSLEVGMFLVFLPRQIYIPNMNLHSVHEVPFQPRSKKSATPSSTIFHWSIFSNTCFCSRILGRKRVWNGDINDHQRLLQTSRLR